MDSAQIALTREKLADMESHLLELQAIFPSTLTDYLAQLSGWRRSSSRARRMRID
jgi:hypothetical protein